MEDLESMAKSQLSTAPTAAEYVQAHPPGQPDRLLVQSSKP